MIIPVYKPVGSSTHQLAYQWSRIVGEKATHTGTLDPLADGVIVVCTGDDRFNKSRYSSNKKHYEVTLLLGIETDSDDLLGLIKNSAFVPDKAVSCVIKELNNLKGALTLPIHFFSAKRVQGSSYFDLAKKGSPFTRELETVNIYSITFDKKETILSADLLSLHKNIINRVAGDFRQEAIVESWEKKLLHLPKVRPFKMLTFSIECSKRTYIRSIARHISEKVKVPLTVFSLTRTKNGPYGIADCVCLI